VRTDALSLFYAFCAKKRGGSNKKNMNIHVCRDRWKSSTSVMKSFKKREKELYVKTPVGPIVKRSKEDRRKKRRNTGRN
jgi:hypothetical protein